MTGINIFVAADAIISFLKKQGITKLHNFPGGTIAPLLDSCLKFGLEVVTSRNEQGAGYAALAQAKITGLPGVVAVTSGPGVTNVITPVADAYFDSIPMLVLTGQIGSADLISDTGLRQRGFQEIDTPKLMQAITKSQYQPHSIEELIRIIPLAWHDAITGRNGPVAIDLPMDIQRSQMNTELFPINEQTKYGEIEHSNNEIDCFIDELMLAISASLKPLLICGNGMVNLSLAEHLRKIQNIWKVPVSHSLLAVGLVDSDSTLCLGYHGHTGGQVPGIAIEQADLIVVLGSRLDIRQTGNRFDDFAPNAKLFRVDFDQAELNRCKIKVDHMLNQPLHSVLPKLLERLQMHQVPDLSNWHTELKNLKEQYPWPYPIYPGISPQAVIESVSKSIHGPVICVTGVGAHQQWVARHFRFAYPKRQLFTSAGHGAMGYDLPMAIGAAIHAPDKQIICIVGDGSFQMNIQELGVISERNLSLKIIVLDNKRLGLVSQFQLMNWETDEACGKKHSPDFCTIAKGYGINSLYSQDSEGFEKHLSEFISCTSSILWHIQIDERHDVLPMLLPKQKTDRMWPYFDSDGNKCD